MPDVTVEVAFAAHGIRRFGAAAYVGCRAYGQDAADGSLAALVAGRSRDHEGLAACQGRAGRAEPAASS
jgi:hypothetical protein